MLVVAGAGLAWCATPAIAAGNSIQISIQTLVPEQDVPVQIELSGTIVTTGLHTKGSVDAVVRAGGGIGCQPTFEADTQAAGAEDEVISFADYATGPFSFVKTYTALSPGSYLVCAWVEQGATLPATGPVSTTFTVRGPAVPDFSVNVPVTPSPDRAFQIVYTTETDQQLALASTITAAGGAACAADYELEQEQNPAETVLLNLATVFGGPLTTTATTTEPSGTYIVCTWVEGPNSGQVDASTTTPITVPAPGPQKASLALTHVTASRGHGATIAGTTAPGLAGRVRVYAACGKATKSTSPQVKAGRFSGHVALPKACRHDRRVIVGAVWRGSSAFSRQSVSKTVGI